jgi:hypothetical protein
MREPAGLCSVCGLSGFPEATLSYSETGLTCQTCHFKWEIAQREQALAAEREAANAVHRWRRWRMLAVAVLALVFVIASNWHCSH